MSKCQRGLLAEVSTLPEGECTNEALVTVSIPSWSKLTFTYGLCRECHKEVNEAAKSAEEEHRAQMLKIHTMKSIDGYTTNGVANLTT